MYLEQNINFPLKAALRLHQAIMWQELVPQDLIDLSDESYREFSFAHTTVVIRGRCSNLKKLDSGSNY